MYKSNSSNLEELIINNLEVNSELLQKQWCDELVGNTRYFILDDLLPSQIANQIYENFPNPNSDLWIKANTFRERKSSFAKIDKLNPIIGEITDAFHGMKIIKVIQDICKIKDLEADPSLYAGGISLMQKNDFLNPHIDNSHDASRVRYRRLNLLYYISPDWDESCGGNFELWNDKVTKPFEIVSKFNRLVVMETNDTSWHSVNTVTTNRPRCCVSNYYFSKSSPKEVIDYYHPTSFLGRPNQTFLRVFCRLDNLMRHGLTSVTGFSRGKNLTRYSK